MHMPDHSYLSLASSMHRLTEPAIRAAISALAIDLQPLGGGHGLDAACGNGDHSLWLAQTLPPGGRVTGIDICREGLLQARASSERAGLADNLACIRGDLLRLPFLDRTFDWAWCADALWPGPQSQGFLGMDLLPVLRELVRVVRPGGLVAVLFWSSQRLLPGHPFLEARLNATRAACYPFEEDWRYRDHILSAPIWLQDAGLEEIQGRTLAADLLSPSPARSGMILPPAFKCSGAGQCRSFQMPIECSLSGSAAKSPRISLPIGPDITPSSPTPSSLARSLPARNDLPHTLIFSSSKLKYIRPH